MRRGLLLLVPLVAILVGVWALRSDHAFELDPVASAATKTTDAGSARVALSLTMKAAGRTMKIGGQGAFDFEDSRGTLTMDASALLPGGSSGGRFELRMLGSMIYMRMPASLWTAGALSGKRWIAFDVRKALGAAGLGNLDPASLQQDPTQTLRLLRASSTGVQKLGSAEIRGVTTTRYRAKLDLAKSLEASGDELGLSEEELALLRRAARQMSRRAGLKTIPVEIFVDAEGLLRRFELSMKSTVAAEAFGLTQTTDFYDFGRDVDVQAPPKAHVFDLSGLAGP